MATVRVQLGARMPAGTTGRWFSAPHREFTPFPRKRSMKNKCSPTTLGSAAAPAGGRGGREAPTFGDRMTCMGMFWSGARTGTARTTMGTRLGTTRRVPWRVRSARFAAAGGTRRQDAVRRRAALGQHHGWSRLQRLPCLPGPGGRTERANRAARCRASGAVRSQSAIPNPPARHCPVRRTGSQAAPGSLGQAPRHAGGDDQRNRHETRPDSAGRVRDGSRRWRRASAERLFQPYLDRGGRIGGRLIDAGHAARLPQVAREGRM